MPLTFIPNPVIAMLCLVLGSVASFIRDEIERNSHLHGPKLITLLVIMETLKWGLYTMALVFLVIPTEFR